MNNRSLSPLRLIHPTPPIRRVRHGARVRYPVLIRNHSVAFPEPRRMILSRPHRRRSRGIVGALRGESDHTHHTNRQIPRLRTQTPTHRRPPTTSSSFHLHRGSSDGTCCLVLGITWDQGTRGGCGQIPSLEASCVLCDERLFGPRYLRFPTLPHSFSFWIKSDCYVALFSSHHLTFPPPQSLSIISLAPALTLPHVVCYFLYR